MTEMGFEPTRAFCTSELESDALTTRPWCQSLKVLPGFEPGSPDSESEVLTSYTIRPDLQKCHLLGSNQGPSDLQSDALPTELKRLL